MNVATAFIYGIVTTIMLANLIYAIIDMKRMAKDAKRLDSMHKCMVEDIEVGKQYIDVATSLTERLDKIEEKVNSFETKTAEKAEVKKTTTRKTTKKTKEA